jgi:hypothetical protein
MKILVHTANLGDFDPVIDHIPQIPPLGDTIDFVRFTNENFPPRLHVMTPRLQARIPKMFGWQMRPGYDFYIWIDSSCTLLHPESVRWFLEQCRGCHMAVFKHPDRNTITEEYEFVKTKIEEKNKYLVLRYENELADEQMAEIRADKAYKDEMLFASTAFVYANHPKVHALLKEWWYHTSRYHAIDQLSFPYVIWKSKCTVRVIPDNYLKTPYLTYTRNKKHG